MGVRECDFCDELFDGENFQCKTCNYESNMCEDCNSRESCGACGETMCASCAKDKMHCYFWEEDLCRNCADEEFDTYSDSEASHVAKTLRCGHKECTIAEKRGCASCPKVPPPPPPPKNEYKLSPEAMESQLRMGDILKLQSIIGEIKS